MIYTYFGDVGSGKTFMLAWHAFHIRRTLKRVNVWANFGLRLPAGINYYQWKSTKDDNFKNSKCGLLICDEAGLLFNSRKASELSEEAKERIVQHRKDDLHIVLAAQSVKYMDLMFREQGAVAFHMRAIKIPFLGFFFPDSVVRTRKCACCGHVPLDVHPDDRGLRKWLAFGTMFLRRSYSIGDLMVEGALQAVQNDTAVIRTRGIKFFLYSQQVANAFNTTEKLFNHG